MPEKIISLDYYKNSDEKEIIYYTLKNKPYFYTLDTNSKNTIKENLSTIESPKLVCSKTGNILLYGRNILEIYANNGNLINVIKPEKYFNPDKCIPLSNDFSSALFIVENKAPLFWYGKNFQDLPVKTTGQVAFDVNNNKLFLAVLPFNAITFFNLPSLEAAKPVSIGKLKPIDKNEILYIFSLEINNQQLLVVDHRGNVSTISTTKRKWYKNRIFSVEK